MNLSYWEKQHLLREDHVVVVGAGIVGLCTAIFCQKENPQRPIIVIERGLESSGASTKNAGFACFGSASEILNDMQSIGEETVVELVKKRYHGLQRLLSLVDKSKIDYLELGGYEVFREEDKIPTPKQIKALNELLADHIKLRQVYNLKHESFGMETTKPLVFNPYEGQLNPYRLINELRFLAISRGISIHYGREVLSIDQKNKKIKVDGWGDLAYQSLAICTNGFANKLLPHITVRPARNQVLITEPVSNLKISGSYHCDKGYLYFRNYQNRIILGGGRNKALEEENTSTFGLTNIIQEYLMEFLHGFILPGRKVEVAHWWSGIMGLGDSKKAIVMAVFPNLFVGVRLGGMGVALGSEVGYELSQLINS